MSAFLRTLLLLYATVGCADSEPRDRDDDDERSRVVNPPIVDWLEEIAPILESNRAVRDHFDALFLVEDCERGPASRDETLATEVGCDALATDAEGTEEVEETDEVVEPTDRIVITLTEQILPGARDVAEALAAVEVEDDEVRLIHRVLLAHWQDRVTDWELFVDAWNREDAEALEAAFEERLRSRRSMGVWLEETNARLAEQGVRLAL